MTYDKVDKVIEKLFLINSFQIGLEISMKVMEFIFDCVHLLYLKCYKVDLNRGGSYFDCRNWIKYKKLTINHINNDNKCFQYPATASLNHDE